jgi:hypothetical protein
MSRQKFSKLRAEIQADPLRAARLERIAGEVANTYLTAQTEWKPQVGEVVCDCRYRHIAIAEIEEDGDTAILADGASCSIEHCLEPVNHPWAHPHDDKITPALL